MSYQPLHLHGRNNNNGRQRPCRDNRKVIERIHLNNGNVLGKVRE